MHFGHDETKRELFKAYRWARRVRARDPLRRPVMPGVGAAAVDDHVPGSCRTPAAGG